MRIGWFQILILAMPTRPPLSPAIDCESDYLLYIPAAGLFWHPYLKRSSSSSYVDLRSNQTPNPHRKWPPMLLTIEIRTKSETLEWSLTSRFPFYHDPCFVIDMMELSLWLEPLCYSSLKFLLAHYLMSRPEHIFGDRPTRQILSISGNYIGASNPLRSSDYSGLPISIESELCTKGAMPPASLTRIPAEAWTFPPNQSA